MTAAQFYQCAAQHPDFDQVLGHPDIDQSEPIGGSVHRTGVRTCWTWALIDNEAAGYVVAVEDRQTGEPELLLGYTLPARSRERR